SVIRRGSLVAEFLFNGNAGDTSGNSFHGVVHSATPPPDRFGHPNSAYAFDGKDDYIVVSPPPTLLDTALTVSVWARCDSTSFKGWHDCVIDRTTAMTTTRRVAFSRSACWEIEFSGIG